MRRTEAQVLEQLYGLYAALWLLQQELADVRKAKAALAARGSR